tara:strand:- start:223 stop:648 length:426 start_codon:yes stop_codon:yes gene_type:complete
MSYINEKQANTIIEFVDNEIKKAKKSKIRGFSLKEIANLVYYHFNKNNLFRLFSIEYMKSKLGYENNFNELIVYNRNAFNAVINETLTYNKKHNIKANEINLLKTYAKLTKNHISLVDIDYIKPIQTNNALEDFSKHNFNI